MPKASPIQYAFNGGQLGPRLQGRSDLARYATGCNTLRNFIPTYQGPAIKRSGFRHVKPVKDSSKQVRVLPFEFSRDDAYVLELGEGYLRVYKNSGSVLESTVSITGVSDANPVVVTAANSYSAGDQVFITGSAQTEINDRYFTVANPTGANFELSGEDGTGRSTGSGGTAARVYEITDGVASNSLPWLEAELAAISFVQSADVLYLAHGNHAPHKITRTADTSWTCTEIDFTWPAFREENLDSDILMMAEENEGTSKEVWVRGKTADEVTITSHDTATPIEVTTASNHGYSTGDTVFIAGTTEAAINDTHYTITVTAATTFTLDGSTGAAGGTGGTSDKLLSTDFTFTSDMVGSHVKLREPAGQWTPKWQQSLTFNYASGGNGIDRRCGSTAAGDTCYWESNVYALAETPGAGEETGFNPPVHTSFADNPQADENYKFNYYNSFSGYGEITAVASDGLSCTVTIETGFPYMCSDTNPSNTTHGASFEMNATPTWSIGAWSDEYGYPQTVTFYEDRLWFGGTTKDPQTFWGSRTGDYENFEIVEELDDSALVFTLASDKINAIEWMNGQDVLLLGTRGGEFTVDAGSADSAITPSNIRVRRRSNYGSAEGIQPIFIDSALLFVQRSKTRLHELIYSFQSDRYVAPDLTQMSYDILLGKVQDMAYQASPLRLLWAVLEDGTLASLTYIRDEEVIGWATHTVGGTSAAVESVAVIPHPDGDQDQVWVVTKRTVNSATVRHIEYLEKPFAEDAAKEDAFFVDAGLTYSGASTTTITGLEHLEGESVQVLGDGFVLDAATVSGGSITLGTAVEKAQVGLAIPAARLQTMRLEAGAADGTAMGKRGRVYRLVVRLHNTGDGLNFGTDFTTMDEWHVRDTDDSMDTPVPLYTGDTPSLSMPSGYERDRRVAVEHSLPLPATIVSLMPQLNAERV